MTDRREFLLATLLGPLIRPIAAVLPKPAVVDAASLTFNPATTITATYMVVLKNGKPLGLVTAPVIENGDEWEIEWTAKGMEDD